MQCILYSTSSLLRTHRFLSFRNAATAVPDVEDLEQQRHSDTVIVQHPCWPRQMEDTALSLRLFSRKMAIVPPKQMFCPFPVVLSPPTNIPPSPLTLTSHIIIAPSLCIINPLQYTNQLTAYQQIDTSRCASPRPTFTSTASTLTLPALLSARRRREER